MPDLLVGFVSVSLDVFLQVHLRALLALAPEKELMSRHAY